MQKPLEFSLHKIAILRHVFEGDLNALGSGCSSYACKDTLGLHFVLVEGLF